jgi:hypothetical protein
MIWYASAPLPIEIIGGIIVFQLGTSTTGYAMVYTKPGYDHRTVLPFEKSKNIAS